MDKKELGRKFLEMSDYDLAHEQLTRDLLFQKIPPEQVEHYVCTALKIGADVARACATRDIYQLCADNNIRIELLSSRGKYFGVRMRAEIHMSDGETKILLYQQSIEDIARSLREFFPDDQGMSYDTILKMHLAHEFFHYIEQRDNMRVNEMLPKVVTFRFLGLQRKATILTLSEVAAHSFSKELLRLPHYPYLNDKLYALSL
jgi:hypothetical protein